MNPGETIKPSASMIFFASELFKFPKVAILSELMPISIFFILEPVPSIIFPFLIIKSNILLTKLNLRIIIYTILDNEINK